MKLTTVIAAFVAMLALAQGAHAREYHGHAALNYRQGGYHQAVYHYGVYHRAAYRQAAYHRVAYRQVMQRRAVYQRRAYQYAHWRSQQSLTQRAAYQGYWHRRTVATGWSGARTAARYRYDGGQAQYADRGRAAAAYRYQTISRGRFAVTRGEMRTPAYRGGVGGRPSAWCGWEMRQLVGRDPGPEFNLARRWAQWGHAGPAGVGAVVVWPHHVGMIVGRENGQWIVKSGNDGNRVRARPLPISNAIAIRWS
jgi:hypothetical protein